MRQLGGAADQHFLENGTSNAAINSLVGSSAHVKSIGTAANEIYPANHTQGEPFIVTGIAGVRTLTYIQ